MRFCLFLVALVVYYLFLALCNCFSADIGNCLLCHKYPGLSRVDSEGNYRLFYVNEDIFNHSIHAKVKCEGCHPDITNIPHEGVKEVDCFAQCHIVEPSSEQKFSHQDVETYLSKSVHSRYDREGKLKEHVEDIPTCKDCHDNPLYRPISFNKTIRAGISEAALGRCRVCHKSDEFIFRFYNHVTTRLHKIRNPINISEVCARCHDDPELVSRHRLSTKAGFSYGKSFHGKAAKFLDERIPDCLDCHVREGESVHQMLSHEDPLSSTYPDNKANTCSSADCHPSASPKLAEYKIHAEFNFEQNPKRYFYKVFFIALTGGTLLPLMGIIFLDCLRRLFPDLTLRTSKKQHDSKP